jgi:hypothetical protein
MPPANRPSRPRSPARVGNKSVKPLSLLVGICIIAYAAWTQLNSPGTTTMPGGASGGGGGGTSSNTTTAAPTTQPKTVAEEPAPRATPESPLADRPSPSPSTPKATNTTSTPASSNTTASGARPATIRLAAWNIEWLGLPQERSGFARGVAQKPAELAEYIATSGSALIALQEIIGEGSPPRSKDLDAVATALNSRDPGPWLYILFPGRGGREDQLTGILWNSRRVTALASNGKPFDLGKDTPVRVALTKSGERPPRSSQGSALWNRPPHAMKFSAGPGASDFVVISVHMKADFEGTFAVHRREEAQILADALPQLMKTFADRDILLAGDTNITAAGEPAIQVFTAAGFADLNAANLQTHWRGGFTDRVLAPADQPEFATRSFKVWSDAFLKPRTMDNGDFKRNYSDHFLVFTDIKITDDDD